MLDETQGWRIVPAPINLATLQSTFPCTGQTPSCPTQIPAYGRWPIAVASVHGPGWTVGANHSTPQKEIATTTKPSTVSQAARPIFHLKKVRLCK